MKNHKQKCKTTSWYLGIDESKKYIIETFEGYDKKTVQVKNVPKDVVDDNQKSKHDMIVTVVSNWCWYGLLDGK